VVAGAAIVIVAVRTALIELCCALPLLHTKSPSS
jgi:hypothetical protein